MKKIVLLSCSLIFLLEMCSLKKKEIVVYHTFENHEWLRHDSLIFSVQIEKANVPYDIIFFARHTKQYEFTNLDFAMIMKTPSDEERINEYSFKIKNSFDRFTGTCNDEYCEAAIPLKKGIVFSQKGLLRIEIENLVPRMKVKELLGVGIILKPAG